MATRLTSIPEAYRHLLESCTLCPRACRANRAQGVAGRCGANGQLLVARAALHEWEEPPISAFKGSGTIFFSNCSLRCVYCQNREIAQGGAGFAIDVPRLADIMCELQQARAANINLVTATHYLPWVLDALAQARAAGMDLPVVWNTSGYETVDTVDLLAGAVDVYLADFKYASSAVSDAAQRYSAAPDYFDVASRALCAMAQQVGSPRFAWRDGQEVLVRGVVVRHLLLPGRLDDSKAVIEMLWRTYGTSVLYSIMNQYTPLNPHRLPAELQGVASSADYERLLDYADSLGIDEYYWQDGPAARESFIPPFDGQGVLTPFSSS